MERSAPADAVDRATDATSTPRPWRRFGDRYPAIVEAYDRLRDACSQGGPLDPATEAIVKLAVSVGAGAERTVHMHCKKALAAGVDPETLRHVTLISLPTIGLPAALDALGWVDESIEESRAGRSLR